MPLSELLYRMANQKLDSSQEKNPTSDLPFVPENDFGELVWENGQIQSSKARKIQTSKGLSSQTFKIRDKDGNNNNKLGQFGAMGMELNEIPSSVPSVEMGLDQDNDMEPWLNYPIVEPLQHGFCSEFLPGLSGVTVNDSSSQSNFASLDRRISTIRDSHTVSGDVPHVCSAVEGEATRSRTSSNDVYSSSAGQCQASFPYFRSRPLTNKSESISNGTHHAISGHSVRAPASGSVFPSLKMPKQVPGPSSNNPTLIKFSHFSKPVSPVKTNFPNMSVKVGSGISSVEIFQSKDKGLITSSSNVSGSLLNDSFVVLQKEGSPHCHPVAFSSKVDAKPLETIPAEVSLPAERSDAVSKDEDSRNDKLCRQNADESIIKGLVDVENSTEPVVACSSVCSGNSVERASGDPAQNLKRKHRDTEESEGPSDDIEEESVGAKKGAHARVGLGSKRSRAAEVHNLSERRRRDRINEKMRALQELIPNCNKVDKASMLDEAIEYLKTLQLQVQIMSMGAGLYMPSMMYPGMPHMHAGHMAHFLPMGIGMGMGMGYRIGMPDMNVGSSGCSMYQVPPVQAAHFPAPPMPGPTAVPGSAGSNLQLFGLPGQGFPMPFARAPSMPMPGGPPPKANAEPSAGGLVSHMDNLDSAPCSSSKDSVQNINSEVMQSNVSSPSMIHQTSSQLHVSNDHRFEHSSSVQSNGQASEATENGALKSANGDACIRATGKCESRSSFHLDSSLKI